MDSLRLATPEEISSIQGTSDLTPASTIVAFDRKAGKPDLAVIKQVTELDPVYFAEETDSRRKALFIWALENTLRLMGTPNYYFNVAASDKEWLKVVETWGAERTSKSEEFRFVKRLQTPPASPEKV